MKARSQIADTRLLSVDAFSVSDPSTEISANASAGSVFDITLNRNVASTSVDDAGAVVFHAPLRDSRTRKLITPSMLVHSAVGASGLVLMPRVEVLTNPSDLSSQVWVTCGVSGLDGSTFEATNRAIGVSYESGATRSIAVSDGTQTDDAYVGTDAVRFEGCVPGLGRPIALSYDDSQNQLDQATSTDTSFLANATSLVLAIGVGAGATGASQRVVFRAWCDVFYTDPVPWESL